MQRLINRWTEASDFLVSDFHQKRTTHLFIKVLLVTTLIKIFLTWPFSHTVMKYHNMDLPGSIAGKLLLAPSFLANENVDAFYGVFVVFIAVALFIKPNYLTTTLFFWLTLNLFVVNFPLATGADLVLFMLAMWCIPLATNPSAKSVTWASVQRASYNVGLFLVQLQVVFIYFVSGWDKLLSETWRSGVAFDYITHLTTMFNPAFNGWFDHPIMHSMLAWGTILFELLFGVLVWFKKARLFILAAGVVFHLFIGIVMSLPDFAFVMIVSYIVFLKDSDWDRFRIPAGSVRQ